MGMHMRCACPGHISQASVAIDKDTCSVDSLHNCHAFSFFLSASFHLLVYNIAYEQSFLITIIKVRFSCSCRVTVVEINPNTAVFCSCAKFSMYGI